MSVVASLGRARRGVVWYLKEFTGEARWDDYLERCARDGRRADVAAGLRAAPCRPPRDAGRGPLLLTGDYSPVDRQGRCRSEAT